MSSLLARLISRGDCLRRCFVAVATTLLGGASAGAATFTWTGASAFPFPANDNWSNPFNWQDTSIPPSADTTEIIFGTTVRAAPIQDLASPFILRSMIFNADNYILGGGSIALDGPGSIHQNSNSLTISNPLVLQSNVIYNGAGSASLNGVISGSGGLNKQGPGNLTLGNANTFTGDTLINAGQVRLGNALALQNSTVNIGLNDGLTVSGPSSVTLGNLSGTGNWNIGSATISVGGNGSSPSAYSGAITGTGTIVKFGNGTLTLGGTGSTLAFMSLTGGSLVLDGGSLKLTDPFLPWRSSAEP